VDLFRNLSQDLITVQVNSFTSNYSFSIEVVQAQGDGYLQLCNHFHRLRK
jgi:hypothetical protein